MDEMILIILAALALVQLPEPQRLPRFPRLSLISFRQWRTVRRQMKRDRAFDQAMQRIEQSESECVRAAVLSQLRNNELPISEEAHHVGY